MTVRESIQLEFGAFGDKTSPLLLLIPGAGAPAEFWPEDFCRNLASHGLFVVRYSHRDTGHSTHLDELYGIEELLLDMKAIVDVFENPTVHVAGHSMGGYLAQMAMCRFPDDLASATSISAGSTVSSEIAAELGMSSVTDETWQILIKNQPAGDFDTDLPGWLESWRFLNGERQFDEELAIRYTQSLYAGDSRNHQVAANHIHAMSTVPSSLAEELKSVQCPFLVIHGTADPLVPPDNGEASARLVPNSNVVWLRGAGHMFFCWDTWDEIGKSLGLHTKGRT